eukprot:scaffold24768_cov146-Isochrysis_galbana.AAC.2
MGCDAWAGKAEETMITGRAKSSALGCGGAHSRCSESQPSSPNGTEWWQPGSSHCISSPPESIVASTRGLRRVASGPTADANRKKSTPAATSGPAAHSAALTASPAPAVQ